MDSIGLKKYVKVIGKIILDLVKLTDARYGYVFQREFSKIVGYEYGVISGLKYDHPEREFIDKWGKDYYPGGSYKTGDMRDIYPINILSSAHINRQIFVNQSLEQWINDCKRRGRLEKVCDDLWLWHVSEEQISPVREALRETRLLLCI